jgi:diguanylate cyclase (GGDEF)-like protein/PAS domain S-box-containing protein
MNTLEQQTLFEIVMSIGNDTDLNTMLQNSLSTMMRKLGCNMGAVARLKGGDIVLAHSIPHHIKSSTDIFSLCCDALYESPLTPFPKQIEVAAQNFVVYSLPNFGVLMLGRSGEPLPKNLRNALVQIANKLAISCIACEQALAIKEAQQRTQLLLDSAAEGICGIDLQGRCTFANTSFLNLFGYDDIREIRGRTLRHLVLGRSIDDTPNTVSGSPLFLRSRYKQKIHSANETFLKRDGSPLPVEYWSTPIEQDGQIDGAVVTFIDITERKRAERELQASEARLSSLIRTIPDLIWMKNAQGMYLSCNPMFERFIGASESEIMGKSDFDFFDKELAGRFRESDLQAIAARNPVTVEERVRYAEDAHEALLEITKAPTYDAVGRLIGVLSIARDISARKASEDQIKNLAFYDPLTRLPNRRLLLDRLEHAIATQLRNGSVGALLLLDLDNFKTLNDSFGHAKGDLLLQQVADRLRDCIRASDTAARFGGDEFIILLENLSANPLEAATDVKSVGEKIIAALNIPHNLSGYEYRCDAVCRFAQYCRRADEAR